jgi:glycosyltransferase involved in cell wall biosynthesis
MKRKALTIVFVIDIYDSGRNGTSATARRSAEYLRRRGHIVRVVSTGRAEADKYVLAEKTIPLVSHIAGKQSFIFAEPDRAVLREAFSGADIIHFFLPLPLEIEALKIAREMGIPCCSAFHLQPENITYNIYKHGNGYLARQVYRYFNTCFYKDFSHIHCPSQFIAGQLSKNRYRAKLHVISNGIPEAFRPADSPRQKTDDYFHILSIGRLAPEKRHDLLIEGVCRSKYNPRIQLHFAGDGPLKKSLVRMSRCLRNPPIFGYYRQAQLIELMHHCQLYIHPSDVEIEAIACLEAIACGLVPLISNSPKSATPQFALCPQSLFRSGSAADLAEKLDFWIENEELRRLMGPCYAQSARRYSIENSIDALEDMFREVIEDEKAETA